jgi:hypothetical protein
LTTALAPAVPDLLVALIGLLSLAAGLLAFLASAGGHGAGVGLVGAVTAAFGIPAVLCGFSAARGYGRTQPLAAGSGAHRRAQRRSSLLVDGQLIIVDAPCSGVQMAWLGYFTRLCRGLGHAAQQPHLSRYGYP